MNTFRIKNNNSKSLYQEIAEKIHARDKLYKIFKLTRFHVDKEIYKERSSKFDSKKNLVWDKTLRMYCKSWKTMENA